MQGPAESVHNLAERVRTAAILAGRTRSFQEFLTDARPGATDVLIFNSSFLFREVETKKASLQVGVRVRGTPPDVEEVVIVEGLAPFTASFKKVSRSSTNLTFHQLPDAIAAQLTQFGQLAFVLIGAAAPTEHEELMSHPRFRRLVWDSSAPVEVVLDPDGVTIRVRQVKDEAAIWGELTRLLEDAGHDATASLRDTVCQALNAVQENAIAELTMPTTGTALNGGMTERIADGLEAQTTTYRDVLTRLGQEGDVANAMTEIYRIAYTFASDALTYLQLVVSVCDLKPLLLWLTLPDQLQLNEAFAALPWRDSRHKPSLKNYRSAIGDARNSAFHNAMPFRHSLTVRLPSGALENPTLTFFAPFGGNGNSLTFHDKELVEVLLRFSRARERLLPRTFWEANAEVMARVVHLLRGVSDALIAVHPCLTATAEYAPSRDDRRRQGGAA